MNLTLDQVDQHIKTLEKDSKAIKEELFKICWYMRGGITVSECYMLDLEDRKLIGKIIEGNLETTKETGLPFF